MEVAAFVFCTVLAMVADLFFAKPRRVDYYIMSGILIIAYALIEGCLLFWGKPHTATTNIQRVAMALIPIMIWYIPALAGLVMPEEPARLNR